MMTQLNPQQIQILKAEGYTDQEIAEAVAEVEKEKIIQQKYKPTTPYNPQTSAFAYNPNDNLIKWQLELNEILERAEHILREDKIEIKDGKTTWTANNDMTLRILTNYGVQEIMRILSMYLNRNTILGNYTVDEINDKVYDFGTELNDLFFMKYEKIFSIESKESISKRLFPFKKEEDLNKKEGELVEKEFEKIGLEKRKSYPMIVRMLVDAVHSAYTRAIGGGERSSLREARQLTQQEQIQPFGTNVNVNAGNPAMQKRSVLNPMRYLGGKYKV